MERTATVRLRAIHDQYVRAMKESEAATKGVVASAGGLEKIGGKMQAVGGTLTRSVTMPLALAGGAAAKLSLDFEKSFATMVGLAGVTTEEVDGLKESVLELAGETAVAPQELADALYFAASAGLDTAGAMEAVEVAARASAAGMGKTEEVVGLVASAIASYGEENINAAEATDILTSTIRAGRADPAELAGTLGRILPIASQLGVEFDEVGGTVAYLSNVFGDTNRTVTAVSGLLVKLVSPSQQGREALEEMGSSVEALHAAIDEDGLMGALDLLREKGFAGNQQALRKLFDDIEGYQGALALLNDKSGTLTETLGEVSDSAGSLDTAFGAMAETAGFANSQAFAKLQVALIQIGDILVPLIADIAEFAAVFLEAFSALPKPAQTAVVAFGALLAATGPLLSIGGKLVTNWHAMGRGVDALATGAYDAAGNLGRMGKAMAGIGTAIVAIELARRTTKSMSDAVDELRENAGDTESAYNDLREAIEADAGAVDEHTRAVITARLEQLGLISVFADAGVSIAEYAAALEAAAAAGGDQNARAEAMAGVMEKVAAVTGGTSEEFFGAAAAGNVFSEQIGTAQTALEDIDVVTASAVEGVEDYGAANAEAVDPVQELEDAIKAVTNALRAQLDPLFAAQDALLGHAEAQRGVEDAQHKARQAQVELNEAIAEHGRKSPEAYAAYLAQQEALRGVEDAQRDVVRAALDVATATTELKMRMDDGSVSTAAATDQLALWVDQGLLTTEQAMRAAEELGLVAETASAMGGDIAYRITVEGFETLHAATDQFGGRVIRRASGGPIPGSPGEPVPMIGHGGEFMLSADVVQAIKNGKPTQGLGASFGGSGTSIDYGKLAEAVGAGATIHQTVHAQGVSADEVVVMSNAKLGWALTGRSDR